MIASVNLVDDQSLKNTLLKIDLDKTFLDVNFMQKGKQYDHIPMAYNAQLVVNQIRHDSQGQHLKFY